MGLVVRRPVDCHRARTTAAGEGRDRPDPAHPARDGLGRRLPMGAAGMTRDQLTIIVLAAGWSGLVGVVGLVLAYALRRRSLRWGAAVVAAVAVGGLAAGLVATARAMFLSEHD